VQHHAAKPQAVRGDKRVSQKKLKHFFFEVENRVAISENRFYFGQNHPKQALSH
jgi:hypothetical protein